MRGKENTKPRVRPDGEDGLLVQIGLAVFGNMNVIAILLVHICIAVSYVDSDDFVDETGGWSVFKSPF